MRFRAAVIAALAVLLAASSPTLAEDKVRGPDIVTVIGKISNANRGAFDPFFDSLFKFHEKEFKTAYGLSYSDLAALPQIAISAQAEGWPSTVKASGPKLKDVLNAAGVASDATLAFLSLDGYALELPPKKIEAKEWVLAITANGRPLGIGGRGPTWLLYETDGKKVSADATGQWVYQLFLIEAQ